MTRLEKLNQKEKKDNVVTFEELGVDHLYVDEAHSYKNAFLYSQMAKYGDMAVTGVGVAMKVTMITGMICIGFGQGIQPLLGYCVGAKNWKRYKEALRFSVIFGLGLSTVMTILCYVFDHQIVGLFLSELEAFQYGVEFSRILLTTSFSFGMFYVLSNALQAMGAATSALIINMSRQGLIYIPALFILKAIVGMKGLLWAQPVADVLSVILVVVLYQITLKKKSKAFAFHL